MNFQGWKYQIDQYRKLKPIIDEANETKSPDLIFSKEYARSVKEFRELELKTLPEWMDQLDWSAGPQVLPQPFTELTLDEWLGLGKLGFESENASFCDGMNIPGEPEWFGGWSCHTHVYGTFALVDAHMADDDRTVRGKGHLVHPTKVNSNTYVVRFFRVGCEHRWHEIPEESRMCYHVSRCATCGMKRAIDSSD